MDETNMHTVPLLVGGKSLTTASTFPVVCPSTSNTVYACSNADAKDATSAVEAAAAALPGWRRTTARQRRDLLLRAAEVMKERSHELAGYMMAETGASQQWADFNLATAQDLIVDAAGRVAASVEGAVPATQDDGLSALVLREPFGVVLAVAPWNAPYILSTRAVLYPLAAGNTVVLKGSELSPRTMRAICDVFAGAGLPPGALNFVVCSPANAPSVTEALVRHREVRKVNFTGSTAVGRLIGRLAGEELKPALLELGGKAPAIVWEDADLALAADQCALGAFVNAGQVCMSTERILVHRGVAARFRELLTASVERFFPAGGDAPLLVQEATVAKNRALLRDAVGKGAEVVLGDVDGGGGRRMRPVVVAGVTPEMDIYGTESFGPTVSLIEIDTEEEALRIANDTEYGLTSAVFTEDLRRGLRLARGIETGAVHINGMSVHDESGLPHGGAKASGWGRFNASCGIDEWLRSKNVTYRV